VSTQTAVLLAAAARDRTASEIAYVIAVVIVYLVPLYLGYRIGTRKRFRVSQWLWQVLLFNWLGVLYLWLKAPSEWANVNRRSACHGPPRLSASERQDFRDRLSSHGQPPD
jgi:hypothetical protein